MPQNSLTWRKSGAAIALKIDLPKRDLRVTNNQVVEERDTHRLGRVCVTKKSEKKKNHHGATDREFRFRSLVPPDGSVGEEHEKMQFFRKVIARRSIVCCFSKTFFRVCFCGCQNYIFFSRNATVFPATSRPNFLCRRSSGDDGVSVSILGKSARRACIRRYECSVVHCARF